MNGELSEQLTLELEAGIEVRESYENVKTFEELKQRVIRVEQIVESLLTRFLSIEEYFTDNEIIHMDEYEDRIIHSLKSNLAHSQKKKEEQQ
jgi:hypothetical protein